MPITHHCDTCGAQVTGNDTCAEHPNATIASIHTPKIQLTDDGTLDTVLKCADCGEEFRYNSDNGDFDSDKLAEDAYAAFVAWAIEDAASEHVCGEEV